MTTRPIVFMPRRAVIPKPLQNDSTTALIVQWYRTSSPARQAEIDFCMERNVHNGGFDALMVFVPGQDMAAAREQSWAAVRGVKLVPLPEGGRLTYADALRRASDPNRVYVVANSDIVIPARAREQLVRRVQGGGRPVSVCLTRWESDMPDCRPRRLVKHARSTQDLWAFRGGHLMEALAAATQFPLGVPGCDHKIALALSRVSKVINPCLAIQTMHIHRSGHRTYTRADRLQPPYLFVEPSA